MKRERANNPSCEILPLQRFDSGIILSLLSSYDQASPGLKLDLTAEIALKSFATSPLDGKRFRFPHLANTKTRMIANLCSPILALLHQLGIHCKANTFYLTSEEHQLASVSDYGRIMACSHILHMA
jgi:hypothetical protein